MNLNIQVGSAEFNHFTAAVMFISNIIFVSFSVCYFSEYSNADTGTFCFGISEDSYSRLIANPPPF